jgi:hypothetical protein
MQDFGQRRRRRDGWACSSGVAAGIAVVLWVCAVSDLSATVSAVGTNAADLLEKRVSRGEITAEEATLRDHMVRREQGMERVAQVRRTVGTGATVVGWGLIVLAAMLVFGGGWFIAARIRRWQSELDLRETADQYRERMEAWRATAHFGTGVPVEDRVEGAAGFSEPLRDAQQTILRILTGVMLVCSAWLLIVYGTDLLALLNEFRQ